MLTFKKAGYTSEELLVLYDALTDARSSLRCAETGCDQCPNRRPCADLSIFREYIFHVASNLEIHKR